MFLLTEDIKNKQMKYDPKTIGHPGKKISIKDYETNTIVHTLESLPIQYRIVSQVKQLEILEANEML